LDNVFIEALCRSLKYEEAHLKVHTNALGVHRHRPVVPFL